MKTILIAAVATFFAVAPANLIMQDAAGTKTQASGATGQLLASACMKGCMAQGGGERGAVQIARSGALQVFASSCTKGCMATRGGNRQDSLIG